MSEGEIIRAIDIRAGDTMALYPADFHLLNSLSRYSLTDWIGYECTLATVKVKSVKIEDGIVFIMGVDTDPDWGEGGRGCGFRAFNYYEIVKLT